MILNDDSANDLIQASTMQPSRYKPSHAFLSSKSVGIKCGDTPVLVTGFEDDKNSHDVVDRLIGCDNFSKLMKIYLADSAEPTKAIIDNGDVFTDDKYTALVKKPQGIIGDDGSGAVQAILLGNTHTANTGIALNLCVSDKLMKCFHPQADDLPVKIDIAS